jgi:hypothetical protein
MKKYPLVLKMILFLVAGLFVSGCGPKIEKFGEAPDEGAPKTAISSILNNPQKYQDKEVVIEGKISKECPGGCWMKVSDDSGGTIYVEMAGACFVPLPQRTGRPALVKGIISQDKSGAKEVKLFVKGVTIR